MPPTDRPASDDPAPATYELAFAGNTEGLDALHHLLDRVWQEYPESRRPAPGWQAEFMTGVGEIVANIIRHSIIPAQARDRIQVHIRRTPDLVEATFINEGAPFAGNLEDPAPVFDPLDPLALPEGRYGLALARNALDTLRYERDHHGYNRWVLGKRLEHPESGASHA